MTITYSQFQGPLQLHKAKNWLPTSALDRYTQYNPLYSLPARHGRIAQ